MADKDLSWNSNCRMKKKAQPRGSDDFWAAGDEKREEAEMTSRGLGCWKWLGFLKEEPLYKQKAQ